MSIISSYQARLESPEEKPEGTKPRQEGRPKPEVASSEVTLASADTALFLEATDAISTDLGRDKHESISTDAKHAPPGAPR